MSLLTDSSFRNSHPSSPSLLDEPEHQGLLRITALMEHLFRMPIAYLALFGSDLAVVRRIGSGRDHWDNLATFPLAHVVGKPTMWPDPSGKPVPGFKPGRLRFATSAPLRSSDGIELGVAVMADVQPRPEFTSADLDSFGELAAVLAGKLELRMLASEARETESAIQEAERRFRNIANAAPVLIIYSDANGAGSFVNQTWLEFTGRTFDEEVGDGFIDRFHPDYREPVMQKYWEAFEARRPHTQEFLMRRHDGVYRWMRAEGVPRFRGNGAFAGYIGCFVDVTEERAARMEVARQKLVAARLAEAAGVFYLLLDRDGVIEDSGPGADLRKHLLWELLGSDESGRLRPAFARAAAGLEPVQAIVSSSFPTGKFAERCWSFTPIVSAQRESMVVLATIKDHI